MVEANELYGRPTVQLGGIITDQSGLSRTVMRTAKDISGSGDTELVAAQTGLRIRLLALSYQSALAVSIRFKSAGNNLSALYTLAINGQLVWPYNPHGWPETGVGEALNVNQSGAIASAAQIVWTAAP